MAKSFKSSDDLSVRVLNWEKYNPRSDLKFPVWFRCENNLFDHEELCELENAEILVWIYILALSSKRRGEPVNISWKHVRRTNRFKPADVISALEKLQRFSMVQVTLQNTNGICTDDEHDSNSTRRDETLRTQRNEQDGTGSSSDDNLPHLARIWNRVAGKIYPRVRDVHRGGVRDKACRARWSEHPDESYWTQVIERMNQSPFLCGQNGRSWKANFDFLCKPDSSNKILEGAYDGQFDESKLSLGERLALRDKRRSEGEVPA